MGFWNTELNVTEVLMCKKGPGAVLSGVKRWGSLREQFWGEREEYLKTRWFGALHVSPHKWDHSAFSSGRGSSTAPNGLENFMNREPGTWLLDISV